MAYKIGVSVEVLNKKQLKAIAEALVDVINDQPAATTKVTIAHEVATKKGKRKVTDTVEIGFGEKIELDDLGLVADTPIETFLKGMDEGGVKGGVELIIPLRKPYEE